MVDQTSHISTPLLSTINTLATLTLLFIVFDFLNFVFLVISVFQKNLCYLVIIDIFTFSVFSVNYGSSEGHSNRLRWPHLARGPPFEYGGYIASVASNRSVRSAVTEISATF
jgi:hypothetical protein